MASACPHGRRRQSGPAKMRQILFDRTCGFELSAPAVTCTLVHAKARARTGKHARVGSPQALTRQRLRLPMGLRLRRDFAMCASVLSFKFLLGSFAKRTYAWHARFISPQ